MRDLFDNFDLDDEIPDFDHPDTPKGSLRDSAEDALALVLLDAAMTRKTRAIFKRHPSLIIIEVPDADWGDMIANIIGGMERAPLVRQVTERKTQKGLHCRIGADDLTHLGDGKSVLFISPDPRHLLHEAVLASADATITLPALTPTLLRKVICRVTGRVARGVTEAMARLDIDVITALVRRELTAGECVAGLARAVARQTVPTQSSSFPLLSDLPLTESVRKWTDRTLVDLAEVKAGSLAPDQLVFGVLEGPPGTGKTLIAESLAHTAGWNFVSSSVGSWFTIGDGALGGVAQNLGRFINELLAREPAIGLLDEIEALPNRASMDNRGRDWWTPVITLFLTEVDRLRKSGRKVMLLGATNYHEHLDAALVRPGRMQQRISVLPSQTEDEVEDLLRYYIKGDLPDADLARLARIGRGATPAMVEGWLKEARAEARAMQRPLEMNDVLAVMVPEDDRSPEDIRAVAIHECGHAVVAHRLGRIVESVSIIPEGDSSGRMIGRLPTLAPVWRDVQDTVTVTLAGRAADIVLGRGPNAGAEGDLANATALLVDAFDRHGLRGDLTYVPVLGARSSAAVLGVGVELRCLLGQAIAIIKDNRGLVLELADLLIAKKVLSGAEVVNVLEAGPARRAAKRRPRSRKDEPALCRAVREVIS